MTTNRDNSTIRRKQGSREMLNKRMTSSTNKIRKTNDISFGKQAKVWFQQV
jgi:hypothetical protein